MLLIIGLAAGLIAGYYISDLIRVLNEGIKWNVFGYEISIDKNRDPVTNVEEKKSVVIKTKTNECGLCNGEDMFIKGTKNVIPYPECNRNGRKFKTLPI